MGEMEWKIMNMRGISGPKFPKNCTLFRETKGAYALEVEARDGAPSARPNSGGQPNTGQFYLYY
jgi:hypothetical protein